MRKIFKNIQRTFSLNDINYLTHIKQMNAFETCLNA